MPEINIIPIDEKLLTDDEFCKRLNISYATLYNHLRNGPPTKRHQNVPDIRTINYIVKGGQRRWLNSSVEDFLYGQNV
jgi:predicted transcriptional regulator